MENLLNLYNVMKSFLGFGSDLTGMNGGVFPIFITGAIVLFFVALGILILYKAIKLIIGLVSGLIAGFFV